MTKIVEYADLMCDTDYMLKNKIFIKNHYWY